MTGLGKKETLHLSHLSSVYLCKHNKSAELIITQPDGTSCDADLIKGLPNRMGRDSCRSAGLNCKVLTLSCFTTG